MVKSFLEMSTAELQLEKKAAEERYNSFKAMALQLDMSRGKPDAQQLSLSLDLLSDTSFVDAGVDCRNYGILEGLPSCRQLFAELLGVSADNVIIGGSSSLNLMYDFISQGMTHGFGSTPWAKLDKVKFLCPTPGYDRHFTICEHFGIEMLEVPMTADGPDIAVIEELVKDSSVKGMFCVPKYSNPQGITFSDDVVKRIAALKPAAPDFRIVWDNAYAVHDLTNSGDKLLSIFDYLPQHGNENLVVMVASTSKITFAGAGVSVMVAMGDNLTSVKKRMNAQTISHDKLNQHRHVQFFKNADGVTEHMKKHAAILKPKFDCVLSYLESELGGSGVASWFNPNGGYFISLDVLDGCASRVGELCRQAGVVLTPIGATHPYGIDKNDKNIRIAPSFPPVDELKIASELLCVCVKLAAAEKLLASA